MEIIASDLKKKLDKLNNLLTNKGLIEGSDLFHFDKESIFAFNGEAFIGVFFKNDLFGAVEGDTFYKLIDKYGTDEIIIEQQEESLIVKKGRSKSIFNFDTNIKCPLKLDIDTWKKLPDDFMDALNVCIYATGTDYTDMRTTCIHIKDDIVESTDTYRIMTYKMKKEIKDELFIPNEVLTYFNKSKPIQYSNWQNWVYYMDLDETIIAHRKISFEADYPDLQEKINCLNNFHKIELPQKLYDSLQRASIFLKEKFETDKFVLIKIYKNKLRVTSKGMTGKYSDVLKIDFDDNISFEINPKFLMDAMEKETQIEINDDVIKVICQQHTFVAVLESKKEE